MKTKPEVTQPSAPSRPLKVHARQMRMPDEIPPKFGVQSHDELQAQGVVSTDDISNLISVFGVDSPGPMSFPFQRHGASDGKRFELRVEPSGSHSVAGTPMVGHQWIFRQTYPELRA